MKSVPVLPLQPRRELVRQQIDVPVPVVYRNLEQFKKKILPLVMKGWSKTEGEDSVDKNFTQKICEKNELGQKYM